MADSCNAFLRVKILQVTKLHDTACDPQLAVNIKEVAKGPAGGKDTQIVQRKGTFYPEWGKCFDSHLQEGRRMQVLVKDRAPGAPAESGETVAELTVLLSSIAEQCRLAGSGVSKMSVSVARIL